MDGRYRSLNPSLIRNQFVPEPPLLILHIFIELYGNSGILCVTLPHLNILPAYKFFNVFCTSHMPLCWIPRTILTCHVHGLLQETALATVLKLFNVSFMFYGVEGVAPRMGLVVPFCAIPFGPVILFLVPLSFSLYSFRCVQ